VSIPIVKELSKVRDELDRTAELICAAHLQHVIDTLASRGVSQCRLARLGSDHRCNAKALMTFTLPPSVNLIIDRRLSS
jgi:hypothetical protein